MKHLPPPPAALTDEQANDPRPLLPPGGATSEQVYERWNNDALDWGERRNALAYRWCSWANAFLVTAVPCGPKPAGLP